MSSPLWVLPLLFERALLTPQTAVDGDLTVVDFSRRNQNVKVISESGPSFLVKRAVGHGGPGTVAYEAAIYRFLRSFAAARSFDEYLPAGHDNANDDALILELLPDAVNMREYHVRLGRFPVMQATAIGYALSRLHIPLTAAEVMQANRLGIARGRPLVFDMYRPSLALFQDVSAALREVIGLIQRFPDFCSRLDQVRGGWRQGALVHGDLRWDNCLVVGRPGPKRQAKLVDWEFARIGDPDWDVGCFFAEYLAFWVLSIPFVPGMPPESAANFNRVRFGRLQPPLGSFWRSYARGMGMDRPTQVARLLRATAYAAVRLIEGACEQAHSATTITPAAVALLQMSFNVLADPVGAVTELLGIIPTEAVQA
jgi:hypothetical protein